MTARLIEISTKRLILRQWRDADLPYFAQMNQDSRVMEFFPSTLSREQSDAMAAGFRMLIDNQGWGLWAIEIPGQSEFVGFTGLHRPQADLPCSPCIEIGWRLSADFWGQGYATEAARAALDVGFNQLNFSEIVSFTAKLNIRSQAVMERLDMQRDKANFYHPAVPKGHPLQEHVLYRLSKPGNSSRRGGDDGNPSL